MAFETIKTILGDLLIDSSSGKAVGGVSGLRIRGTELANRFQMSQVESEELIQRQAEEARRAGEPVPPVMTPSIGIISTTRQGAIRAPSPIIQILGNPVVISQDPERPSLISDTGFRWRCSCGV